MIEQAVAPPGVALQRRGPRSVVTDTWFVFWREMLLPLRDPFSLIFSLIQPLVFLGGLFGPLLGSAVGAPGLRWPVHAAMVPSWSGGDDRTVRHLHDRLQPAVRTHDRFLRTDPGHAALPVFAHDRPGAEGVGSPGVAGSADLRGLHSLWFRFLPLHVVLGLVILGIFASGSARCPMPLPWSRRTRNGSSGACSKRCCSR